MRKAFWQKRSVRSAGWLIGGKLAQSLLAFVVGILTVRYLKPEGYGLLSYAGAYTVFFAGLANLGIPSVLGKELLDHPGNEGAILGTAMGLRGLGGLLAAGLILALVAALDRGEGLTLLVAALCALAAPLQAGESLKTWFQVRLEAKTVALTGLLAYALAAGYRLWLMATGKSVVLFALTGALQALCLGAALYGCYRGGGLSFSWDYARRLLRKSGPYILPALMIAVYGQTDRLMLKQLTDEAEVGYYAAAVSLGTAWCFLLSAGIDSLHPGILEAHRDGRMEDYRRGNLRLYALVFHGAAAVSLLVLLLARPLVRLVYGPDYLPAAGPLRLVVWYTAFAYLGVARNAWVVSEEKQRYLLWVYLAAALANVLLNAWLIPLWGGTGAALASLLAQVVSAIAAPLLIAPLRPNALLMLEAIRLKGLRNRDRRS